MKKFFKWGLLLTIGIFTVSLTACSPQDWATDKNGTPKLVMKSGVNINPVKNTNAEFKKLIQQDYPNLDQSNTQANDHYNFVIPGLIKTQTLVADGQNKTVATSTTMDPQGLAITPNYMIISAYSRDHKHNSVLYFIDKDTGKYIKHLVLPDAAHVGGIAYDTENEILWITTRTNGKATISSVLKSQLAQKDFSKTHKAISFKRSIEVPAVKRASFMGFHDDNLYIGYFDEFRHGHLTKVPVNDEGIPDFTKVSDQKFLDKTGQEYVYTLGKTATTATVDKLQGINFYKNLVLFSKSYADKDSELLTFKNQAKDFDDDDIIDKIKFPPYMEEIAVEGNYLYVLFESGAKHFRNDKNLTVVGDHLLRLNLKSLRDEDKDK